MTTHVKERQENLLSKQIRMEQLTEEQQKQVKKMSTTRIRQRLIKAGFTEVGLEGLSREIRLPYSVPMCRAGIQYRLWS